jgi:hypothetical protein
MRFPWASRTEEEQRKLDEKVDSARAHLRILVNDLNITLHEVQERHQEGARGEW